MTKLDDRTVVPLTWLIGGFAAGIAPLVASVFWVASVNFRLQRIEEKLGIPAYHGTELLPSTDAFAKEKTNDDTAKLSRPVYGLQAHNRSKATP